MSYFTEVMRDGPQAYWRLGEASGTEATDASGFGRHGLYVGSPTLGQAGALANDLDKAVLFDGANDEVQVGPPFEPSNTFTVEFWFKPQSGGDATQNIFGEADGSPAVLWKSSSFKLSVFYSAADHENTTPLPHDTAWYHVAIVVNAGSGTFYVNGVADGVFSSFPTAFAPGRIANNTATDAFKGYLDEVAWYRGKALSAARVAAHYAAAWPGLIGLRPRLRQQLHDEDSANYRWTDEVLDRHLLSAVDALSEAWPQERKTTLTTTPGSRDVSLATIDDLVRIEAVEYPTGRWPPEYVQFQTWGSTLTLLLDAEPSAAEDVNVYWGRRHQLEKFTSTLPKETEETLLVGAGAFALLEWAQFAINRVNITGPGTEEDYKRQGEERLREFRRQLRRFGRLAGVRTSSLYMPATPAPDQSTVTW
jgi:hypothetical protein